MSSLVTDSTVVSSAVIHSMLLPRKKKKCNKRLHRKSLGLDLGKILVEANKLGLRYGRAITTLGLGLGKIVVMVKTLTARL